MMTPGERMPLTEARHRHKRCREILIQNVPSAGGLLAAGPTTIYYLTGTLANGVLWLPLEGEPVLLIRKGLERARMESPLDHIVPFRSFRELPRLCGEASSPLSPVLAVDQQGMSWEQGRLLAERLRGHEFVPGDMAVSRAKAVKSEWELAKIRISCERLYTGQRELAARIRPGMSESRISRELWDIFLDAGHAGPYPTGMTGSALLLGHICAGENGNYPSSYDGPVGIKGEHPAAPVMGHAQSVWRPGQILTVDCGFNFEGYLSDRTQIYFAGSGRDIPAIARKAHDAALAIAGMAAAALKPGAVPAEIYRKSLDMAGTSGFSEGFMGLGDNKVRFLGHGIGLTVSEWPIFANNFGEPLRPGMTVALEPKIGIPGIGMVGTENTYEITETGATCLTGNDNAIICVE